MKKRVLILAGGRGLRAGAEMPKQFVKLLGIPVLWWSVRAFHAEDPEVEITLVMHPDWFAEWEMIHASLPAEDQAIRVRLVPGGETRGDSVRNGLEELTCDAETLVAVHDAARPLITCELIARGWKAAAETGTAVPVVPVTDSLRELSPVTDSHRKLSDVGSRMTDRARFVAVQTPQVFRADLLAEAYRLEERPEFTDDASRVEALGKKITLYQGDPTNLKITNPADFAIVKSLLSEQRSRLSIDSKL